MRTPSISKTVIVLSLLLALAIMNMALFYFKLQTKEQEIMSQHSFLSKIIENNEKEISKLNYYSDSLELEYSRAVAGYQTLKKDYDRLAKSKIVTKENYLKKVPDERAMTFLVTTQQDTTGIPVFYKDSLLVPMDNVDNAMMMIYDGVYCDSVVIIKDEEIELLQTQISRLESLNLIEKQKNELHENAISIMEARLDVCAEESAVSKKKEKVQKVFSRAKEAVIIGGLIYILIK